MEMLQERLEEMAKSGVRVRVWPSGGRWPEVLEEGLQLPWRASAGPPLPGNLSMIRHGWLVQGHGAKSMFNSLWPGVKGLTGKADLGASIMAGPWHFRNRSGNRGTV